MKSLGVAILVVTGAAALAAPFVAPHEPRMQFRDHLYAPPMRVHVRDEAGAWRPPFVYPLRLVDRLERLYEEDRSRRLTLRWFSAGKLVRIDAGSEGPDSSAALTDPPAGAGATPLLLLGGDGLGRDILSRLVFGARTSLGLALLAALGALAAGALAGSVAGYAGGMTDELLMRLAELVLILPAIYVVLALRSVMPLVVPPTTLWLLMGGVFAAVGWPVVARGVRAIIVSEKEKDYVAAAVTIGAGPWRIVWRHLLPATYGFLAVQAALLVPAFILAEATLSFVGLGFSEPTPSWGTLLQDAANVGVLADFPWLLAPAAAIALVTLAVNLVLGVGFQIPGSGFRVPGSEFRVRGLWRPT